MQLSTVPTRLCDQEPAGVRIAFPDSYIEDVALLCEILLFLSFFLSLSLLCLSLNLSFAQSFFLSSLLHTQ